MSERLAHRPLVEDEADVEGLCDGFLGGLDGFLCEALLRKALGVDVRGADEGAVADRVVDDLLALLLLVAEHAERLRDGAVDDLEVAAAGELLELHQREVGLDAGRVAVHDQADGAGGRDDGRLRVAVAVLLAERERAVPAGGGAFHQVGVGAGGLVERDRAGGELLVAAGVAVGGAAVVADHPQHRRGVLLVLREGAEVARHLGGRGVGGAGHDRGDGGADGAALLRIVGDAGHHQEAADVGEAEAEGAVVVRVLRDGGRGELRHGDGDFEHHRPQLHGMFEEADVEVAGLGLELHQVERGEVTGRVVQEHVFRARVGSLDLAAGRAGVPVVDGGVELDAGVGGRPCGVADLLPQVPRR